MPMQVMLLLCFILYGALGNTSPHRGTRIGDARKPGPAAAHLDDPDADCEWQLGPEWDNGDVAATGSGTQSMQAPSRDIDRAERVMLKLDMAIPDPAMLR